MVHRLALVSALICTVVLALPQTAFAKGPIIRMRVCGASGCTSVSIPYQLKRPYGLDLMMGSPVLGVEPPPGPFYRLRLTLGEIGVPGGRPAHLSMFYLPGGTIVRQGAWQQLRPRLASDIDEALRRVTPFVPTLAQVRITRGHVHRQAAYAALLRPLPLHHPATVAANVTGGIGLYVRTTMPTPWGPGGVVFCVYDPKTGVVFVADEPRVSTGALRRTIARDAGLVTAPHHGDDAAAVWAVGIIGVASAGAMLLRHRGRARGEGSGVA